MTESEALVPICMIGIILLMMTLVSLWVYKKDVRSDFILRKRLTRINWKKVIKWFVYLQGIFLLIKYSGSTSPWILILSMPAILIGLLLVSFFFVMDKRDDSKDLTSKEFEDFSKAYVRDKKLENILK